MVRAGCDLVHTGESTGHLMARGQSPLVGYNTNVRHKGKLYHIQTEDSGVSHPHIITHLFADGGRIVSSKKTNYAQHVGAENLHEVVKKLMQEQHKAMFIALRDCVFDEAEEGTEYVITRYRDTNSNLRTQFVRIIKRAGESPWPRIFHNMRASRQTELTANYPLHVCCRWLGNSAPIADKHYLTIQDELYEKAAQNAAQYPAASGRNESHKESAAHKKAPVLPGIAASCESTQMVGAPPRRIELLFSD